MLLIVFRGTEKILSLCRRLKKLVSAVHVSTAYANCDRNQVGDTRSTMADD